jgi:hypothetical protein
LRSKILFTFLLAAIIIIGLNGTDITNRIFGSGDIEQTAISKNSVQSDAVYMSSYDEISFDPMKIIDYKSKMSTFITPSEDIVFGSPDSSPFTISDMMGMLIRNISFYSDKTAYAEPADMDIEKMVYVDSNGYFFVEKHKYYNDVHEERYVDMIFDSHSFSIIYLNFYDDTEYNTTYSQIKKGINRLNEYSNSYYDSIIKYENINTWILSSYTTNYPNSLDIQEHPNYYFDASTPDSYAKETLEAFISTICRDANIASKISGGNNPVIKFFMNATAPSLITFMDIITYGEKLYDNLNYGEPYTTTFQVWDAYYVFYDILYTDLSPYDKAEYASYNGRIYQTLKTNTTEKYVIIYNIVTNEIEGFYVKPSDRLW